MQIKELKQKSIQDLEKMEKETRQKLAELRFKVYQKQLKNINELKNNKKDLARTLTAKNELKNNKTNQ